MCLFTILVAVAAYGQSAASWRVNIPFKFSVGQKEMPAGEYQFQMQGSSHLSLKDSQGKHNMNLPIITRLARMDAKGSRGARVVFDTSGDQRALSEVWPPEGADGYLVSAKKGEHGHEVVK